MLDIRWSLSSTLLEAICFTSNAQTLLDVERTKARLAPAPLAFGLVEQIAFYSVVSTCQHSSNCISHFTTLDKFSNYFACFVTRCEIELGCSWLFRAPWRLPEDAAGPGTAGRPRRARERVGGGVRAARVVCAPWGSRGKAVA